MPWNKIVMVLGALCCLGALWPAGAQTVYRCGRGGTTYSDQPCSKRIVNTDEAAVPKPDISPTQRSRLMAQWMRRLPDETPRQFEVRRHRAALTDSDRDECARLDKRMPVEEAGMTNPDHQEAANFEAALANSRKRFRELRC